jgi:hypothetical protein
MQTNSFSQVMANLVVALTKNALPLRPYSTAFSQDLGYRVFRFERPVRLSGGQIVQPDVTLLSDIVRCTLLLEWTESDGVSDRKEDQLARYSRVDRASLTETFGVPPLAAESFDTVIILRDQAVGEFEKHLARNGLAFPLLEYGCQQGLHHLRLVVGRFSEKLTQDFFATGVTAHRIPTHYLPVCLDSVCPASVAALVARHLVRLILQDASQITTLDFCRGFVPEWSLIDESKRGELFDATHHILRVLRRRHHGGQLVRGLSDPPQTWEFMSSTDFRKSQKSLRTFLSEFVCEQRGGGYQTEIPYPDFE